MASDTFLRFPDGTSPGCEVLQIVLEDYIGEAGRVYWNRDRFNVELKGRSSLPFRRTEDASDFYKRAQEALRSERFFEVHVDLDRPIIDVITRQADEYTNVVAQGFVELCKRFWKAKEGT